MGSIGEGDLDNNNKYIFSVVNDEGLNQGLFDACGDHYTPRPTRKDSLHPEAPVGGVKIPERSTEVHVKKGTLEAHDAYAHARNVWGKKGSLASLWRRHVEREE